MSPNLILPLQTLDEPAKRRLQVKARTKDGGMHVRTLLEHFGGERLQLPQCHRRLERHTVSLRISDRPLEHVDDSLHILIIGALLLLSNQLLLQHENLRL